LLFYDNLTYSADGLDALRADHDYNWFSKITNGRCQSNGAAHENITVNYPADCDIYPGNTNPFVNSSGSTPESFSLSNTISGFAGTNICSLDNCSGENKYNIDAFGNTRGNDGIWDIGAYEYGVVAPTDTTAPTVPTGLTATAVSASQINLSWSASYDDVGVAAYDIYRNGSLLITTVATSYSNTGLSAGTQYSYTVSARDAAGNASGQSSAVSATTQVSVDTSIPTVPSNLSATAISSSQINLTWSASSDADGVAGYNVYRNGAQIATSSLNNYSDSGLSASTLYSYTVAAFDPARNYSAQTSPVSVTTQVAVVVTPPSGGGGSSGGGSGSSGGGGSSGGSSGGGFGSGIVPPVETPANNTDNTKSTAPANNNDKGAVNVFVPTTLSGASNNTVNQVTSAESATVISHTGYVTFTGGVQAIYDKLMVQAKIAISYEQRKIIANFIQFGTPTTLILGAGERAGTISSFNSAFSRLPISVLDWQDVIKIGSGRWTTQRSATAEAKAEISFKKIYLRNPNMNQANDNAAVNIMAYGLRPAQRNTNSEKIAILSFKNIFKKSPVSAEEWDAVRAIAYSGAKR
jgi:chitodextrinase